MGMKTKKTQMFCVRLCECVSECECVNGCECESVRLRVCVRAFFLCVRECVLGERERA